MMLRKIFSLLFCILVLGLNAQQTQVYSDPMVLYNRGLELYDKEKFAAAIPEFEAYLEQGKEFELVINSRFYIAFCHMALDHKDAEQQILNLLEEHPDHPKANYARFRLGHYYYNKNNTGNSIRYLEETNANNLSEEDRKTYYFLYGYGLFTKEKYKEAREQLRKIENNKDKYYYPGNYYLGYMSMMEAKDEEALSYFFKISKSKVYSEKATLYIARIYYRLGRYQEVISYTDTLSGQANQQDLSWERGKAWYQLGSYQEAVNNFGSGRATRDMTNEDLYMVGMSYYRVEDYEKAFVHFTAVRGETEPLRQSALMYAADCFLKLGKKTNARNAFYEASRLETDKELQELAWFNYAKLSLEPPFQNEAVGVLSKFIETYPNSRYGDEAKGYLGEALLQAKKYADAIPVIESIKNKTDKIKTTYQQICFFYASELLRQDPAAARIYFEKARTYPMDGQLDAQVSFWMGELYFNEGKIAQAQEQWEKFLYHAQAPETPVYLDGIYNLGYVYFTEKDYARALSRFKTYTEKESYGGEKRTKYLDGMTRLADCYYITKNFSKAIEAYSYVTSKEAANSDYAWFQIGMIHGQNGKKEEKIVTMKRIPSLYPNSEYVDDALFQIALVELGRENYTEALRGFSFLLEDYPNGIYAKRSYLNRGLVYHNLKRDEEALADLKTVVKNYPKSTETEEALVIMEPIYINAGRADEWIEFLENEAKQTVRVSYADSALYNSALSHYQSKNCGKAIVDFGSYLERFPKGYFATQAHFYRSECLYAQNDYNAALEGYLYTIEKKFPEFQERSLRRVSAVYLWKKETDAAIPYLKQLEQVASEKENILYAQVNLMYALYAMDNLEEAKVHAEKVLANEKAQKSEKTDANLIMGRVLLEEEEWDKARPYLEKVEKDKENKNAKGAEAKYYLCFIAFKKGDIKKTQALVYELESKYANQEYWVAMAFNLFAETLIMDKDYFNAKAVLNNIIDNYPVQDDGVIEESKKLLQKATDLENGGAGE